MKIKHNKKNKKYDLKKLIKNTDFEEQRKDSEIQFWQNKEKIGREIIK